mmetsp:Transcript_49507/g.98291  ORF Transcript_49507/g.98291 Transcript_49507/m.98291 type:complete len:435 (+) Transcript_49507:93-1397(+)
MALDTGDTAFMFLCTGLVQFMTPGLAFFYGGLVRSTNVLAIMLQSYAALGFVFILWYIVFFSLAFGKSVGGLIGDPRTFFFWDNVHVHEPIGQNLTAVSVPDIPGVLFAGYQGMFAVITPALMTGAFADRMRMLPYIIFVSLWMLLVYAPVCHWVWGGGWMMQQGVLDFAGGIVVHITSGFSALSSLFVIGKRHLPADDPDAGAPHNVPIVALGTAMLWFGWFGFNGGSALAANGVAAVAAMNSQLAASVALCGWLVMERLTGKKPGVVGACVGAVAGLATITPAAGFVPMWAAFVIGLFASVFCFGCVELINHLGLDDALDVWGVHGMGGYAGTILLGCLAEAHVNTVERSFKQVLVQFCCATTVAAYSFAVTYIVLSILHICVRIRPSKKCESALDVVEHGEKAYVTHHSKEPLKESDMLSDATTETSDEEP